jgi:NAD(P)H-dependent FMN reductase
MSSLPRLLVVIASTRPGRVGLPVGRWFEARAREHGGFEIEVVDLAELALPFMDEPRHPRFGQYDHAHTLAWSATVDRADAFAFVMPEYNHGFTASLKNALDYLAREWRGKPVGFVSYGGIAAGTRAVQLLKPVLVALRMAPAMDAVNIPFVAQHVHEGVFEPHPGTDAAAGAMLDELVRLEAALRPLRAGAT